MPIRCAWVNVQTPLVRRGVRVERKRYTYTRGTCNGLESQNNKRHQIPQSQSFTECCQSPQTALGHNARCARTKHLSGRELEFCRWRTSVRWQSASTSLRQGEASWGEYRNIPLRTCCTSHFPDVPAVPTRRSQTGSTRQAGTKGSPGVSRNLRRCSCGTVKSRILRQSRCAKHCPRLGRRQQSSQGGSRGRQLASSLERIWQSMRRSTRK